MRNLYCSLFGHEYKITKHVTGHVKEYECSHCNKQFTTDQSGHIIALTPKYREINSVLERIHLKKLKKKKLQVH